MTGDAPEIETPGDLGDEIGAFFREKRSERMSPNTVATYGSALRMFTEFMLAHDYPTTLSAIRDEHVTAWLNELHETAAPATVHNRFRALKTFLTWYGTKVDGFMNPMRRMRPPRLPKYEPRVLSLDELRAVLAPAAAGLRRSSRRGAPARADEHRHAPRPSSPGCVTPPPTRRSGI